jgi:hypothetical protein
MNPSTLADPWYRHRWTWIVMSGPAIVVVAALFTAWLAWRNADGVVTDDYYKRGLAVNDEIIRTQRARELGLNGALSYAGAAAGDDVRVWLRTAGPDGPAATFTTLQAHLVHPGRAGADRVAVLARRGVDARGFAEYVGQWQAEEPIAPGLRVHWRATVESRDWRIDTGFDPPVTPRDVRGSAAVPMSNEPAQLPLPAPVFVRR